MIEAVDKFKSVLTASEKPKKMGLDVPEYHFDTGVEPTVFKVKRFIGAVVPIPTLPKVSMRIRSIFFVKIFSGMELVVPNFEVAVAVLLPAKLQYGAVF